MSTEDGGKTDLRQPAEGSRARQQAPVSNPTQPEVLTVEELAALLRVNRKTLYEAIQNGAIPGVFRVGRSIRISRGLW